MGYPYPIIAYVHFWGPYYLETSSSEELPILGFRV